MAKAGFKVTELRDSTLDELRKGLDEFASSVQRDDVVFVYYAGHGVQVNGANYILPRDFSGVSTDLDTGAIRLDEVIQLLNRRSPKLKVLVIDACRDNPFGGGVKGLAEMQASSYGKGTYIAMAAAPNESAQDGLFAKHLSATIDKPGLSVDDVFIQVRAAVMTDSKERQHPFSTDLQVENFYFRPPTGIPGRDATQIGNPGGQDGFWGFVAPNSNGYIRVSYSGFPASVTSGRALVLYFRDYLKATWRTEGEATTQGTLWLEANADPNAMNSKCALGFKLDIMYHYEDASDPGSKSAPIRSVMGMVCYGGVASEAEMAATEEAMRHLRDSLVLR